METHEQEAYVYDGPSPGELAQVSRVVAQWGESFRDIALHPRLRFDGEEIVVVLWKAIQVEGENTAELRVREPKLADMKKVDGIKGEIAMVSKLLTSICAVTEREIGELGMRDLSTVTDLFHWHAEADRIYGARD